MRALAGVITTAKDATQNSVLYLLEIEVIGTTLRYVLRDTDLVWGGGDTYYSRGFGFASGPHGTKLEYGETTVAVDNVDGALSAIMAANDMRDRALRVKMIFVDAAGVPIGTTSDYIDIIDGVVEYGIVNMQEAALTVRSRLTALEKQAPVRNFGASCPWVFGSAECTFVIASTALTAQTADAGCTASIINDAARTEAADYWKDGIIEFTSGACDGEKGRIFSSATGVITLEHSLSAAPGAGDAYSIEQGCDKQYSTCGTRFANQGDFGGFVSLPREIIRE